MGASRKKKVFSWSAVYVGKGEQGQNVYLLITVTSWPHGNVIVKLYPPLLRPLGQPIHLCCAIWYAITTRDIWRARLNTLWLVLRWKKIIAGIKCRWDASLYSVEKRSMQIQSRDAFRIFQICIQSSRHFVPLGQWSIVEIISANLHLLTFDWINVSCVFLMLIVFFFRFNLDSLL